MDGNGGGMGIDQIDQIVSRLLANPEEPEGPCNYLGARN